MSSYGQTTFFTVGRDNKLSADGNPEVKQAGVTVDWSTVTAVSGADVTVGDGLVIKIGEKYLRRGQVLTRITTGGKYGPYDPAAADGRQTLTPGAAFIVNETMKETDLHSDHPVVLYGGLVFKARLVQSEAAAASLALGPTLATLLATFPRLQLVNDT